MQIRLRRAGIEQAAFIWSMQTEAFSRLYEKYRDTETNPAAESVERVSNRLLQPFTYYYLIEADSVVAGAIRVVDHHTTGEFKRISPLFITEPYRNRGLAQQAIREAERIHGSRNWKIETILEEPALCSLYEKLGYVRTGETLRINDRMTLVFYEKPENGLSNGTDEQHVIQKTI